MFPQEAGWQPAVLGEEPFCGIGDRTYVWKKYAGM
jgi:hypothetical protein